MTNGAPIQSPLDPGLERDKLELEKRKLRVEWAKAVGSWIPLLAILATVALGVWELREKSRADFELKAAEIVLNASSPIASANKAYALKKIFPERLPANFAESFDPNSLPYGKADGAASKPPVATPPSKRG